MSANSQPLPASPEREVFYKLQSSDNQMFPISEKALRCSITLQSCHENLQFTPDTPIPVLNVTGRILALITEWMERHKNDSEPNGPVNPRRVRRTSSDDTFFEKTQGYLYELSWAADYLEIRLLMINIGKEVASLIYEKESEEINEIFMMESVNGQEESAENVVMVPDKVSEAPTSSY